VYPIAHATALLIKHVLPLRVIIQVPAATADAPIAAVDAAS
jgi:hypothetical protein